MPARLLICAFVAGVALAVGGSASSASSVPGGGPIVWMNATCGSIKLLEFDALAGQAKLDVSPSHGGLANLLARADADAARVGTATAKPLPEIPQGAQIASSLHASAAAFRSYVDGRRAVLLHKSLAVGATSSAVAARSRALGAAFIRIDATYPSPQFTATIDQAPLCALVHG
ncbi:MAG TPA: hypothetical protein VFB25_00940 [Gaiellaceae bacterium]|nr:hypothetical protein [Gaiellaceae bacterium]